MPRRQIYYAAAQRLYAKAPKRGFAGRFREKPKLLL
jgi:hypothetical protein